MKNKIHIVLTALAIITCSSLSAQVNEIVVSGTQVVGSDETFKVESGQKLIFEAGARLIINGGLDIKGSKSSPIVIESRSKENPGLGIVVSTSNENTSIAVEHVDVTGLVQFVRFDPFWYRKSVSFKNLNMHGFNSGEPLIYASTPILDLRDERSIGFSITSSRFYNNEGNVILERVGSQGIRYSFSDLTFNDNIINGQNATMGILHLDFSRTADESLLSLGDLTFVNNYSGNFPIGLSVSGGNGVYKKIPTGKIYSNAPIAEIFYDYRRDSRLPQIGPVNETSVREKKSDESFVLGAYHEFGKLILDVVGDVEIVAIKDSFDRPVYINQKQSGDSLIASYLEGNPTEITLQNGVVFKLPKLTPAQLPPPLYRKVDTTLISPEWPDTTLKSKVAVTVVFPTFVDSAEILKTYEIGAWGGGGIYGAGDIKAKFMPLPSTIDLSGGIYFQYNINTGFSIKGSAYRTTISIHDLYSIGLFSGTKPVVAYDQNLQQFEYSPNSFPIHFTTDMWIAEFEALWHLRTYKIKQGRNGRLIPSFGIGVGVLHFTPYRYAYTSQKSAETYADYVARQKAQHKYNLRKLGSEGQNFLPGESQYSSIAINFGPSFSLTWLRKRWAFKGEMKAMYTNTDYLDDFGRGVWYGGDREKVQSTHEVDFSNTPENRRLSDLNKITSFNPNLGTNAPRSTDGLNDWYYQLHLGLSYTLFK